jgi:hypothetical protein
MRGGERELAVGENATCDTPLAWPFSVALRAPVAASQIRAVRSHAAVMTRDPSAVNAASTTVPVWPFSSAVTSLLLVWRIFAAPPSALIRSREPSGEKAATRAGGPSASVVPRFNVQTLVCASPPLLLSPSDLKSTNTEAPSGPNCACCAVRP